MLQPDFIQVHMIFVFVFQFKKGGPIIAVQVENEYGSYSKDRNYMPFIKEVMCVIPAIVLFMSKPSL